MKKIVIILGLSALIIAENVTIPNIFSANTTAKAQEVNENFNILKEAINSKQNEINASCENGWSIQSISKEGNITCVKDKDSGGDITSVTVGNGLYLNSGDGSSGDVKIMKTGGYYSLHPSDFIVYRGGCTFFSTWQYAFFKKSINSDCTAMAPVHLPSESKIASLSCRVTKESGDSVEIKLYKQSHTDDIGVFSSVTSLSWSEDSNSSVVKNSYLDTPEVVNNDRYSYFLVFNPKATDTNTSSKRKIFWCKVGYSFD